MGTFCPYRKLFKPFWILHTYVQLNFSSNTSHNEYYGEFTLFTVSLGKRFSSKGKQLHKWKASETQSHNYRVVFLTGPTLNFLSTKSLYDCWHLGKFQASLHGILYLENLGGGVQLKKPPCSCPIKNKVKSWNYSCAAQTRNNYLFDHHWPLSTYHCMAIQWCLCLLGAVNLYLVIWQDNLFSLFACPYLCGSALKSALKTGCCCR